jgi:putative tricarboxylic transport membrane protein
VAAAVIIVLAATVAVTTSQIEFAFSSDPLGPRAFPYLLAAALGALGVWYLLVPGEAETWASLRTLGSALALLGVTAAAVAVMPRIGFVPSASLMCGVCAYLFGARPIVAVLIGVAQATFWYVLFKIGLGTYLPAGSLLFPGT